MSAGLWAILDVSYTAILHPIAEMVKDALLSALLTSVVHVKLNLNGFTMPKEPVYLYPCANAVTRMDLPSMEEANRTAANPLYPVSGFLNEPHCLGSSQQCFNLAVILACSSTATLTSNLAFHARYAPN